MAFPNAYGVTARYAMKASPNAAILKVLTDRGLHIDASSGYEVRRAVKAGVPASKISLSSQELPADFAELVGMGATINACSLEQLRRFGEQLPGSEVGLRFNPGVGSGGAWREGAALLLLRCRDCSRRRGTTLPTLLPLPLLLYYY